MNKFILTLVIVLGTVLTSFGQTTVDSIDFSKYDTNYTNVVNYGDSIIVNTKNDKTVHVLMNTYGMVSVDVNKVGVFKFIFTKGREPRIITNLSGGGINYNLHRVTFNGKL
jgi:hypothetical protein